MQIYVTQNGNQSGPFTDEQFIEMDRAGKILQTDLVWYQGCNNWIPSGSLLKTIYSPPPPPPPPQVVSKSVENPVHNHKPTSNWYDKKGTVILLLFVFFPLVIAILFVIYISTNKQQPDYFNQGQELLRNKNYTAAIDAFNNIPKKDKHHSEKQALINSVYNNADIEYKNIIDAKISSLDKNAAQDVLANLLAINPKSRINQTYIDDNYNTIVKRYTDSLEEAERTKNYSQIVGISQMLVKVPDFREEANAKIEQYTELMIKAEISNYKANVESSIKDGNYQDALVEVSMLSKYSSEIEYVTKKQDFIKKKIKEAEIAEYKKQSIKLSYGEMLRNPGNYWNQIVTLRGEIFQKIDGFMMNTKYNYYIGYSGDNVLVRYSGSDIVEEDVIEIVGTFLGTKSYTALFGNENTIPFIDARYVTVLRARR